MTQDSPFPPKTDFYTKTGALLIAEYLVRFWRARGCHGVVARPYKLAGFDAYGVRSNLVNGLPPRSTGV